MFARSLLLTLILVSGTLFGQVNPWLFPIKPGKPNSLAGTVGELRTTHFHTGLDIKTEGVTGLPVYASDDGYISRISVSPNGYGLSLYIRHPNGYTTVYAHLERFAEPYASYILDQQYRVSSFEIERFPSRNDFPVKRGQVIAYSGNSGSSAGPHLHWDVRDPYQRPVNSMAVPFAEIMDTRPPVITHIAFRTLNIHSRVNGAFGRFEFPVANYGGTYRIPAKVKLEGEIGIEILAYDQLDNSYNRCGINSFQVDVNDSTVFRAEIDKLSFSLQSNIYVFYSNETRILSGDRFTKLYIENGNRLPFYDEQLGSGIIHFNNDQKVEIYLTDSYGNQSRLEFRPDPDPGHFKKRKRPGFELDGNILQFTGFTAENEASASIELLYPDGSKKRVNAYETSGGTSTFLVDLQAGIPKSISLNRMKFDVPYKMLIPAGKEYSYYSSFMDITFPENALFDTLFLAPSYSPMDSNTREIWTLDNLADPLQRNITVFLKPLGSYDTDRSSVYSRDGRGNLYYQGGEWNEGQISFSTRFFGSFTIATDSVAPEILPLTINRKELRFRIFDRMSGIDKIRAEVNGEWVLMYYDPKYQLIRSKRKNEGITFAGDLLLSVSDLAGNNSTYKTTIK